MPRTDARWSVGFVAAVLIGGALVTGAHVAAGGTGAGSCAAPSSRTAAVGGIQWAARPNTHDTACAATPAVAGGVPPSPSYHGSPPLTFGGGSVVGTASTTGELTVTPVYWVPGGYTMPTGYKTLINQFIADAAADSGKGTDVFSSLAEYTNAGGQHIHYLLHAGTPVTDTHALPANGCTPDTGSIYSDNTGYAACITNSQLLAEASRFTTANGLPRNDLAHLYMYFLPQGLETCFSNTNGAHGGQCSINASTNPSFCGYHAFAAPPLVANMNYAVVDSPTGYTCSDDGGSNTGGNQSPNGNIAADSEISIASHEISETITDPEGTAWVDGAGNENGDDCAYIYGDSSAFQGAPGARSNQTINGHHYMLQEEFSNRNYAVAPSTACVRQAGTVITSAKAVSFTIGKHRIFTVTTTLPVSTVLQATGKLPTHVTFTDNHDGTATIAGTPPAGSAGTYPVTLTATNGVGAKSIQHFTLSVPQRPVFTSATHAAFGLGKTNYFHVVAVGPPLPGKISLVGGPATVPAGLSFNTVPGGKGTLYGRPQHAGTYPLTFSATNALGTSRQAFTLTVT